MTATMPNNGARQREWRWRRLPVRWRLTAWYVLILTAALVALGATVLVGLRHNLYRSLDEQIEDQSVLTLATIQERSGELYLVPADIGNLENDEHFFRLVTVDGQTIADTSAALGGVPLDQQVVAAARAGETQLTSALARGETIRIATIPVMVDGTVRGVLQVGMSREEIDEALGSLVVLLLLAGPLILAIALGGGYVLAGRAMAPVREITDLAASIDADDLHARLGLDLPDDEIGRLAATFDSMLARIEEAFERQRRFTGDAAHELRTPLSLLRSQVDIALQRRRSANEYRDALQALQEDLDRLTSLVGTLLALARADVGQIASSRAPFDLANTVEIVAEQIAPRATDEGVVLHRRTAPSPLVGDEDLLVQLLVNLISNALAHTPAGGTVTVGCRPASNEVRLWVTDTGEGITPEHQRRVFDRFYRVDHGRMPSSGGAGLGLSICQVIAAAHGGRIDLTSSRGHGTTVEVALPTGRDTRSATADRRRIPAESLPGA